jgi:hypothetical protein
MDLDSSAALRELVRLRVFFGHQSVGRNILDGLRDWLGETGLSWPIVEPAEAPREGAALMHATVGHNGQPLTKCEDFRRLLDAGALGRVDVALLKFCYVDVQHEDGAIALCDQYRATLEDLARRHPATVLVPVTVPLTHAEGGLGVVARELLGRPNTAKLSNLARQTFNDRLRHGWSVTPIFDLAAAESTRPDRGAEAFTYKGRRAQNLVAAYTDDGRHLNAAGRRTAAAALVQTLAAAARAGRAQG